MIWYCDINWSCLILHKVSYESSLWVDHSSQVSNLNYLDVRNLASALEDELAPLLQDLKDGMADEMDTLLWY